MEPAVAGPLMLMPFIDRTVNHRTRDARRDITGRQLLRDKKGESKLMIASTAFSPEEGEGRRTFQTPHVSKHDRSLIAGSGSVVSSDHTAEPDFTR